MDLQRAIESTYYKVCKSKVNTQMRGGKWFDTKAGVRQGSILSPLLVILYMDLVIKEVNGINDNDKQFIQHNADDIAQTAATKEELEKCIGERIRHEGRDVPESVPGPTCLANTLCRLTGIYISSWRLVRGTRYYHSACR